MKSVEKFEIFYVKSTLVVLVKLTIYMKKQVVNPHCTANLQSKGWKFTNHRR